MKSCGVPVWRTIASGRLPTWRTPTGEGMTGSHISRFGQAQARCDDVGRGRPVSSSFLCQVLRYPGVLMDDFSLFPVSGSRRVGAALSAGLLGEVIPGKHQCPGRIGR